MRQTMLVLGLLAVPLVALQEPRWRLEEPRPAEGSRPVLLESLEGLTCVECHEVEAREWARTLHAFAWEDPLYQAELAKSRRKQACYSCHIPQPLHDAEGELAEQVVARVDGRHLGVSCESCHLGPGGVQLGPRGAPSDAHGTAKGDAFTDLGSNALCVRCHDTTVGPVIGIAKDFVDGGLEERGLSCVGCHMAERVVEREGEAPRMARSHLLQTPRDPGFLARAFGLRAQRERGRVAVTVENRSGHRVPGLIGRRIELEASLLDSAGKQVAKGRLALDHQSHLPLGASVRIELAGEGVAVAIKGIHHDPRSKEKVTFLEQRLEVE